MAKVDHSVIRCLLFAVPYASTRKLADESDVCSPLSTNVDLRLRVGQDCLGVEIIAEKPDFWLFRGFSPGNGSAVIIARNNSLPVFFYKKTNAVCWHFFIIIDSIGNQSIGHYLSANNDTLSNPTTKRRLEEGVVVDWPKMLKLKAS
ncbi:hypothetical protein AVEN_79984-1 [Araneus ventricosus]|uniref:Uncharacterized protein n=1 Tax=Araneus ventricosus TaxID=182803 RepID=A0A4Y2QE35_ARAVE|nr:hypothetical protein AVEN_79984-1 [Araneus ventricosus]